MYTEELREQWNQWCVSNGYGRLPFTPYTIVPIKPKISRRIVNLPPEPVVYKLTDMERYLLTYTTPSVEACVKNFGDTSVLIVKSGESNKFNPCFVNFKSLAKSNISDPLDRLLLEKLSPKLYESLHVKDSLELLDDFVELHLPLFEKTPICLYINDEIINISLRELLNLCNRNGKKYVFVCSIKIELYKITLSNPNIRFGRCVTSLIVTGFKCVKQSHIDEVKSVFINENDVTLNYLKNMRK